MEDEGVGSDDERPPTRAAPAESPARESLRPASKKKKPNQQLMIRAMFHAMEYAKAEGLTECSLFFVSDDRLEGFFGTGRVMECSRNFDLLEFEEERTLASRCPSWALRHWRRGEGPTGEALGEDPEEPTDARRPLNRRWRGGAPMARGGGVGGGGAQRARGARAVRTRFRGDKLPVWASPRSENRVFFLPSACR